MNKLVNRVVKIIRFLFKNTVFHNSRIFLKYYSKYSLYINNEIKSHDNVKIEFRGIEFMINTDKGGIEPSIVTGTWEHKEIKIFSKKIMNCDSFIDIGANVGIYSLLAYKFNPNLKSIVAIEPHPKTISILNNNLFGISNKQIQIRVIHGALGNYDGMAKLINLDVPSASRISVNQEFSTSNIDTDLVRVLKLDSLVDIMDHSGKFFCKIDVEGLEPSIIEGGEEFISRFKPRLLFELSSSNMNKSGINPLRAIKILKSNYKEVRVLTPRFTIKSKDIEGTLLYYSLKSGIYAIYLE